MGTLQRAASLIRGVGEAATKAKPFYSAVDEAIASLPNKALGDQFVKELLKRGVKPQEIIDRRIGEKLGAPILQKTRTVKLKKPDEKGRTEIQEKYFEVQPSEKGVKSVSKEEVERIAAENPAPQIREKVLRGERPEDEHYSLEFDDAEDAWVVSDQWGMPKRSFEDDDEALEYLNAKNLGTTHYEKDGLTFPGGENYREILIKLPSGYQSSHFGKEGKDLLAHARVADRRELTYTPEQAEEIGQRIAQSMNISDPNVLGNGAPGIAARKGVITPQEAAQYSHYRKFKNVPLEGAERKTLHIEEIQSDLHQTGRREGYKPSDIDKQIDDLMQRHAAEQSLPERMRLMEQIQGLEAIQERGVPEAPFKGNWHELVMKRLLDDAVRNGYDRVVITPGAEQINRYDLSKQVDQLLYKKNADNTYTLSAQTNNIGRILGDSINEADLDRYVGKDIAEKIIKNEGTKTEVAGTYDPISMTSDKDYMQSLSGVDLQVGGEGMLGFYDKILPSYLNKYGSKWGAKVGQDFIYKPDYDIVKKNVEKHYGEGSDAYNQALQNMTVPVHSFDITPQMREEITVKGQPLYQVAPPAIGAGALMGEEDQGMKRGGAVKKSRNVSQDAMNIAVLNKRLKGK